MILFKDNNFQIESETSKEKLISQFHEKDVIVLDRLFTDQFLANVSSMLAPQNFFETEYHDKGTEVFGGRELSLDKKYCLKIILALSQKKVLEFFQDFVPNDELDKFLGRIYQMQPQKNHFIKWHRDERVPGRVIAISVNLSPEPFEGGEFEIREIDDDKTKKSIHNTKYGQAVIFRVDLNRLEHRVKLVTGKKPKLALTGWFYRK